MRTSGAKKKAKSTGKSLAKRKVKATKRRRRLPAALAYNDRWLGFAWIIPAVLVVLSIGILAKNGTKFQSTLTSAKLIGLYQRAPSNPMGERVAFWSENLMREPGLLQALGSGPEIEDNAPLFPKSYDCTTYIETVGALARSRAGDDLADHLIHIRYKNGKISYENRNHFPEADWIPNNETAGILNDVTVQVARKAGFVASFANKDIDKVSWFKKQNNTLAMRFVASTGKSNDTVTVRLPYIPIDKMEGAVSHLPQGAVMNIVRQNNERFPVLISHQGLLVWKNGVAYFRHASRTHDIREVPFKAYLEQTRNMPWKVVGFNVNTFEG